MIFIVLSSPETVHNTVQYRYCIFSLLYHFLRIRLKHQNPLLSYERKYTVNVQYSVQYTILLLYLMLVMSYCALIYQLNFIIFMHVTRISCYIQ